MKGTETYKKFERTDIILVNLLNISDLQNRPSDAGGPAA